MKPTTLLKCAVAGLMVWIATTGSAFAQSYLGEVCWQVQLEGEEADSILKLAVQDIGDEHFSLHGIVFSSIDGITTESEFLDGIAEIVSDQVVMTLSGTSNNLEEIRSTKYQLQLAIPALNGVFEGIGSVYDKAGETTSDGYGAGTLTLTACPD